MGQAENERKKIFSFRFIPTQHGIGNSKKIAKKCKKLKNIIMALFRPRTRWDRLRLREKKFIVTIHSFSTRSRDFQKNCKKIEKIRKHQYGLFSSQSGTGEAENMEKKKILVLIHSNPTRNREFQKDSKKIKKIKKTSLRLLFKPKWDGRG